MWIPSQTALNIVIILHPSPLRCSCSRRPGQQVLDSGCGQEEMVSPRSFPICNEDFAPALGITFICNHSKSWIWCFILIGCLSVRLFVTQCSPHDMVYQVFISFPSLLTFIVSSSDWLDWLCILYIYIYIYYSASPIVSCGACALNVCAGMWDCVIALLFDREKERGLFWLFRW